IRQHSLADSSPGRTEPTRTRDGWNEPRDAAPGAEPAGDDLMRLIDALSEPEAKPSPAVIGRRDSASPAAAGRTQPPIDIPDTVGNRPSTPTETADQSSGTKSNWIFLSGQWTQVNGGTGVPEGADPLSGAGT